MKKKLFVITTLIILVTGIGTLSFADTVTTVTCSSCRNPATRTFSSESSSTHTITTVCSNCGRWGTTRENHSTKYWYQIDDSYHQKVCICDYVIAEREEHMWNVISETEATCTTQGVITYECAACNRIYEEVTGSGGHEYGSYIANGSYGHRKRCSICNTYSSNESHIFPSYPELSISNPTMSHSYICTECNYETGIEAHEMEATPLGKSGGVYIHRLDCNICGEYTISRQNCSFTSEVTKKATCTELGIRTYTCTVCGQQYDEDIDKIPHVWSDWQYNKNDHWKICTYGCGTENSRDEHVDSNPRNGRCDVCNYLMYIIPVANISSDVAVMEGENATFYVSLVEGSEPLSYQWYYTDGGGSSAVSGATSSSITVTASESMDGRRYYCVVSNPGGSDTTASALLTVYYTFTIGTQPQPINLKKGESGTFSVAVGKSGNPDSYSYQWYVASSDTGAGSRLPGATSSSYTVSPTKNIHGEYFYCVVSNGYYSVTSDRAKLVADVTLPEVDMGTFNENVIINKEATLNIPFTVTDTGEGYTETENVSNFVEDEIIVKVGGKTINNTSKNLTYTGSTGNVHKYELSISNITGDGKLSFEVPANSFKDNFNNMNLSETFSTNVTIDNTEPKIKIDSLVSGPNEKYANEDTVIVLKVVIEEAEGMNANEFTDEDIIVNVDGTENSSAKTSVKFDEKIGDNYYYTVTLENISGNGTLAIEIPENRVKDLANNSNTESKLNVNNNSGASIIIDNIKPTIDSLDTKLESYTSSKNYPDDLDARHDNWANDDVYVQINARDENPIDYYMKSVDGTQYEKLATNQDIIKDPINTVVYFRVYDMAGNYSEVSRQIKIDKELINKPVISLFEQRLNGADYIFDPDKATNKSVYVIPDITTIVDSGTVLSGIELDMTYTYYTLNRYKDIEKNVSVGVEEVYKYDELVVLKDTGYYELQMTMTDIAGNEIKSDVYKVYINKGTENTIRITDINDIGSGISQAIIRVYICDELGVKTSEEAIPQIVIDNPYKEITKNIRLNAGTFYVEVTLLDNVGNKTILTKTIKNVL